MLSGGGASNIESVCYLTELCRLYRIQMLVLIGRIPLFDSSCYLLPDVAFSRRAYS